METESRVAVIGIVVDQTGDTEELNKVLHQYAGGISWWRMDSLPTEREYYQRRD